MHKYTKETTVFYCGITFSRLNSYHDAFIRLPFSTSIAVHSHYLYSWNIILRKDLNKMGWSLILIPHFIEQNHFLFSCCQPHASCPSAAKMWHREAFTIVNVNYTKITNIQITFIIILRLLWAYFSVQRIPSSICCCLSFLSSSSITAFTLHWCPSRSPLLSSDSINIPRLGLNCIALWHEKRKTVKTSIRNSEYLWLKTI